MSTSVIATDCSQERHLAQALTAQRLSQCRTALGPWFEALILLVLVSTVFLAGPAAADAASDTVVTVRPGDTLLAIAAREHTTVAALVAANHIANPNRIVAKTSLVIPVPGPPPGGPPATTSTPGNGADIVPTIVVRRGDTLSALAVRYNTTVAALVATNHIAHPNFVAIGARLRLPVPPVPPGWGPGGPLPPTLLAHPDRMALRPAFMSAAATAGVAVNVLEALCWWESGWQSSATSNAGAVGVCQLEPSTISYAQSALLHNPALNPRTAADNIVMAAAYLHDLVTRTAGNTALALAGYFQGLSSVARSGMSPATKTYVTGITNYAAIFAAAG